MFVVEALRYGDREKHSYVVGVYATLSSAAEAAAVEEQWRSGKYDCIITDYSTDSSIQLKKKDLIRESPETKKYLLDNAQKKLDQYLKSISYV